MTNPPPIVSDPAPVEFTVRPDHSYGAPLTRLLAAGDINAQREFVDRFLARQSDQLSLRELEVTTTIAYLAAAHGEAEDVAQLFRVLHVRCVELLPHVADPERAAMQGEVIAVAAKMLTLPSPWCDAVRAEIPTVFEQASAEALLVARQTLSAVGEPTAVIDAIMSSPPQSHSRLDQFGARAACAQVVRTICDSFDLDWATAWGMVEAVPDPKGNLLDSSAGWQVITAYVASQLGVDPAVAAPSIQ